MEQTYSFIVYLSSKEGKGTSFFCTRKVKTNRFMSGDHATMAFVNIAHYITRPFLRSL